MICRSAQRLARSAPGFSLEEIAAASGVAADRIVVRLRSLSARGPCAAAAMSADDPPPGLFPPGAMRAAVHAQHQWAVISPGTVSWSMRRFRTRRSAVLQTSSDEISRYEAARRPDLPPATVFGLCSDPNRHVRCALAASDHTPEAVRGVLCGDPAEIVKVHLAASDTLPTRYLRLLAAAGGEQTCEQIASRDDCPPGVLESLSLSDSCSVRVEVAAHLAAPGETLACLAGDNEPTVKLAVVTNPSCPQQVLLTLTRDEDWRVAESAKLTFRAIYKRPVAAVVRGCAEGAVVSKDVRSASLP